MPLSIQHQADSAGDKAVSLIADNSGSNVAAAFKGVNKATQNGDTVADLVVSLDGETVTATAQSGATDDAVAAGQIYPLAGIYQATPDEVDDGDLGRVRISKRRGLVTIPDTRAVVLNTTASASDYGDLTVGTTGRHSTFAAPTSIFCDGGDAGFGAAARYIRVPYMPGANPTLMLYNALGVSVDVSVYADCQPSEGFSSLMVALLATAVTVLTADSCIITAKALATGASSKITVIPQLPMACRYLVVGILPASDPSSGSFQFSAWR